MTVLTADSRRHIPASKFAGPGGTFPVEDAIHQRMAISGATRSEHAGNISPQQAARIKSIARAILKRGK